ncbi:hypothetical protein CIB84_004988 [Bambusicola thoracicus]|uniref:Eosinophil peroxidase n=1 Tax=Bambusicola thoracicus TaxID=9083 RepID=A0A2P4T4G6_BAMTH|nr:hypothetical protein CIB84_004988 [Bambusicola thoracicus]
MPLGDSRASEMLELACMHTLFLREHNRLARGLKRLNPQWNGEKIYQEARKIVGAMIQVPPCHLSALLPCPLVSQLSWWALSARGFHWVGGEVLLTSLCSDMQQHAGYVSWRKFCGLSQPRGVESLGQVLNNKNLARKFMKLYGTPRNIDIWVGALAEPFVDGGRVGPLMACLIGTQFRNTRDGDRFWWENTGVFTAQQRSSLAKISLSRIICDNTRISKVSRNIFRANSYPHSFVSCSSIPKLDLRAWKSNCMEESTEQGISLKVHTVPACKQVQISKSLTTQTIPAELCSHFP